MDLDLDPRSAKRDPPGQSPGDQGVQSQRNNKTRYVLSVAHLMRWYRYDPSSPTKQKDLFGIGRDDDLYESVCDPNSDCDDRHIGYVVTYWRCADVRSAST